MAKRPTGKAYYMISAVSQKYAIHPQTLRLYERKGLIEPARTIGKNRRYSERDVRLLRRIQELTAQGVSLEGVRRILELETRMEELQASMLAMRAQLDAAQHEVRAAEARVHREYRRDLVPLRQSLVPVRRNNPSNPESPKRP